MTRFVCNTYFKADRQNEPSPLPREAMKFHRQLPGYKPTPLLDLPGLAKELGIRRLMLKDESKRFGLNAFKVLGASFAIYRFLAEKWRNEHGVWPDVKSLIDGVKGGKLGSFTFTAATAGNHGRAVAWAARMFNQRSVIYVPASTVEERINNIRAEGADVVVYGTYEEALEKVAADAESNHRQIISDASLPGYEEIPLWISAAYQTIFSEIDEELAARGIERPDFVFVQAGVGGLAGAAADYYAITFAGKRPTLICVEPLQADCLLESIVSGVGDISRAKGRQDSIMAGLNCEIPSRATWPAVRDGFNFFMAVDDSWSKKAMRQLFHPVADDPKVISGESGAAGLAGLLALIKENSQADARRQLDLNSDSTVLLLSTEGDTDRESFFRIMNE